MIPYFEVRQIPLWGDVSLAAFGTCVFLGILAGAIFVLWRASRAGIPDREISNAIVCAVIVGLLGSHLVALVEAGLSHVRPASLLAFWNGMDSFGGFFGALLGLALYFRRRSWLAHAEILLQGLVVGWVFGRLGCTLVHDHPGRLSDFVLAIRFPGGARHDLGFYELLYTLLVLVPAVVWLSRRERPPGTSLWLIPALYAPARFLFDFLRQTDLPGADPRYAGLTSSQYACLAALGIALALWRRMRRSGA